MATTNTTFAKIAGISVILVAAASGAVYTQGHPSFVLQGTVDLQLPNDGGIAHGTVQGILSTLSLTTLDGGVVGADGTTTSSLDAGVTSIPVTFGTVLGSASVTGSGPQSFGIPFAIGTLKPTSALAVYSSGAKVPSAVSALAKWPDGSIKWGLFSANVAAGTVEVRAEPGLIPSNPVTAILSGSGDATSVAVNTGSYSFTVNNASVLASVDQNNGTGTTNIGKGKPFTLSVGGASLTPGKMTEASIYRNDGMSAVVVFESDLVNSAAPTTVTNLGLRRVYRFWAGSGLVDVRAIILNYVNKCGDGTITCNGAPNGTLVDSASLGMSIPIAQAFVSGGGLSTTGTDVSLEQTQRSTPTSPYVFNLNGTNAAGTTTQSGTLATNALLEATTNSGQFVRVLVPTLAYMEPQRLKADASGVTFDFASAHIWVGGKQGMATEFSIEFSGKSDRTIAGNTRPVVIPQNVLTTNVLEASPLSVDDNKAIFSTLVTKTLTMREAKGLYGFNVYGGQPRYWGDPMQSEEIAMSSWSGSTWDKMYSGSLMTDYHNSAEAVTEYAMSVGDANVLTRLSRPAALRQLYTQMEQCRAGDTNFYCFQLPRGYGAFMGDFNSSHAYTGNLFLHYYLTGDMDVTRALLKSGTAMRNYVCSTRPSSACGVDVPPSDQWASLNDRVFSQWQRIYRFLGQTVDSTFTADFIANEERSMKQTGAIVTGPDGQPIVMWLGDDQHPGSSSQLWLSSGYDMRNLIQLAQDYRATGRIVDAQRVELFVSTWVKTQLKYATLDSKATSRWPNALWFYTSGTTAATLSSTNVGSVLPNTTASDAYLYDAGKAMMVRMFCSAAKTDTAVQSACDDFKAFSVNYMKSWNLPMSKTVGIATSGVSGVF